MESGTTERGKQYTHQDLVENRNNQANKKEVCRVGQPKGEDNIPIRTLWKTDIIKLTEEVWRVEQPKGENNIHIRT